MKLNYSAPISKWYKTQILNAIEKMRWVTLNRVSKLFNSDTAEEYYQGSGSVAMDESIASQARILMNALTEQFDKYFNNLSLFLAERMVNKEARFSAQTLKSSIESLGSDVSIKTNFITAGLKEIVKASVAENVQLIKSIPKKYLAEVQGAVMRSITTGQGIADLKSDIQEIGGKTARKAELMALDQTRKAYNSINHSRMISLGFKKFEWLHSGGGQHPREEHIEMNGNIYSFDNLPVIDKKTGERGIPGQAINCRCTMRVVYEFVEEIDQAA